MGMLRTAMTRLRRDEAGTALVEFAIVLPLLLLMLAVTIEGGRLMWAYQSTISGVRDAARYLARASDNDACSGGAALDAFEPQLLTMVRESSDGNTLFPQSIVVTAVDASVNCMTGDFRGSPIGVAEVEATLQITFPFSGLFTWGAGDELPTLTTTVTDQARVYGI
jgi:Flp pilus assembly protein TadG